METIKRSTRKSGHSIITTLPPDVLTRLNIQVGDKVEFILNDNRVEIRKAVEDNKHMDISEDFLALVQESMAEYDEALRGLVER
jgi:antitoxin MazE